MLFIETKPCHQLREMVGGGLWMIDHFYTAHIHRNTVFRSLEVHAQLCEVTLLEVREGLPGPPYDFSILSGDLNQSDVQLYQLKLPNCTSAARSASGISTAIGRKPRKSDSRCDTV